jgi:hypothetical protein
MDRLVKIGVGSITLFAAARLLGWKDGFHLIGGAALGAILLAVWFFWKRRRSLGEGVTADEETLPVSPLRSAVVGLVGAGLGGLYLWVGFLLLRQVPGLYAGYYDRDRPELEETVQTLEAAGNYEESATILRRRLQETTSPEWEKDLAARLTRDLVEAGKRCRGLDGSVARFTEAQDVARRHGLDSQLASLLLAQAQRQRTFAQRIRTFQAQRQWPEVVNDLRAAMRERPQSHWRHPLHEWLFHGLVEWGKSCSSLEEKARRFREAAEVARRYGLKEEPASSLLGAVEKERAHRADFAGRARELKNQRRWSRLVEVLQFAMEATPRSEWPLPLDRWLYEARISWGDGLDNGTEQQAQYRLALAVSRKYGLQSEKAQARLTAIEDRLARRRRPAQLPRGAQAAIVKVSADHYPPVLIAEVWVGDAAGAPNRDLKDKDFRVLLGGQPVANVVLVPIRQEAPTLYVLLVIDVSGSMRGEPLNLARTGVRTFFRGLKEPGTVVKILSFNHVVRRCCDWTDNYAWAASQLKSLRAGGKTALLKAASAAVDDLRRQKGQKRLVLFTDGGDTVGGPRIDDIITRCRKEGVLVYTIGLRSKDLDGRTLKRLAKETGGEYAEAVRGKNIVDQYRLISRRIRRSCYRLVITPGGTPPPRSEKLPLKIRVGGNNGVTLSSPEQGEGEQ